MARTILKKLSALAKGQTSHMLQINKWTFLFKYVLLTLICLLLCSMQTTLFPPLFSSISIHFPLPSLWLILIVYISLFFPSEYTLLFIYFLSFIVSFFTYAPVKILWCSVGVLFLGISLLRSRIQTRTPSAFAFFTLISTLAFWLIYILFSSALEKNPIHSQPFSRIAEALINTLFAPILFISLEKFMSFFVETTPSDSGSRLERDDL